MEVNKFLSRTNKVITKLRDASNEVFELQKMADDKYIGFVETQLFLKKSAETLLEIMDKIEAKEKNGGDNK